MDQPKFNVEIVTPDGIIFSSDAVSLKAPGTEGMFGVLANHAPFLTTIAIGAIEINTGSENIYIATSGGFTEVMPHKTTIIAETAELSSEIDRERAEAALERARKRLASKSEEIDIERARLSLHRALNRLKIAQMK